MKKKLAICLLVILMTVVSAQAKTTFKYGTYIGVDDIDNDLFMYPYDEDDMFTFEIYLGDTQRSIEGTAIQHGDILNFKANYTGSQPRYTGTMEESGDNEYTVDLYDAYNPSREESFKFAWVCY